ncbi:ROK family protein [Nitzschia inconspicua]|uniref:ROK family protein n=1 Tax=Nitzschia inconspicua TaxID=303405 RepID=A0A9K3P8Q4_9STRA|nr:ROK family protein [Nitzschia inconspicua]KAG7362274.1 ROK family protein [Nitzschia inconspicua]
MSEANTVQTIAAVEGGGTTFVVAVAQVKKGPSSSSTPSTPSILHRQEIDSSHDDPERTLEGCAAFFRQHKPVEGYDALGIGMFGPVGLNPSSKEYGSILGSSPKAAWRNVNFLRPLEEACRGSNPLSISIDTDVNAPALAEFKVAKADQSTCTITSLAYITVGTGIGVGLVINNKTVHGRMHPEGGHVAIQPLPNDSFPGYSWGDKSPYKGRQTVEGMTSSVALTERLEMMTQSKKTSRNCLADLEDDHDIWDHAANALANLCVTLILTTSIEKIVLGGGIMKRKGLIDKIRSRTVVLLNGYLELPRNMSEFITLSSFGSDIGLMGAIVLAQEGMKDGKEMDIDEDILLQAKRTAYCIGLQHGVILGISTVIMVSGFLWRTKRR